MKTSDFPVITSSTLVIFERNLVFKNYYYTVLSLRFTKSRNIVKVSHMDTGYIIIILNRNLIPSELKSKKFSARTSIYNSKSKIYYCNKDMI